MEVRRAKVLGFCMGVRRAVDMAAEAVALPGAKAPSADTGSRVYTLGPLIHNPQALESLKGLGVEILKEDNLPSCLDNSTVIIRAHGVAPQIEADLVRRGAHVVDATCPRVKASQMKAKALASQGYRIFLAGEKNHAEIIGMQGYVASELCAVVGDQDEAERAAKELCEKNKNIKTALIGQTTITPEEYLAIGEGIKKIFPDLEIINSICGATRDRQEALRDLCTKVDGMIIAGGKRSANTRRLLDIARAEFARLDGSGVARKAWLVETPDEIPSEAFAYSVIGLAAGASTPDSIIDAMEAALRIQPPFLP
ncbi:4-hydroxy-3-methylbut-2-enyl diphosphate reductase [Leadbettera azotonutricia]|uniref:4-hydroxy-3-methylbut-2-enyl diphosphate reductase n=1 Tax=Leadbettera azotonutricia (strain ATCC BAA-888 / DSM 13862 / ZAS-9) TaxID=545695 RepID=F5Y8E1_LEAAZ|nr:4-hydroxy-3-methylbut-2-enyl diphosphate reductase [Leadbettera azotonutricia]AEF82873.1 4-hydroxy-3-methylbut-2-enyl diphosphate reductase [Leadbettera azotonutricia ZAS-9]